MKSRCTAFLGSWGVVEGLELGQLVRFGNSAGSQRAPFWGSPRQASIDTSP